MYVIHRDGILLCFSESLLILFDREPELSKTKLHRPSFAEQVIIHFCAAEYL